MQYLIMQKHLVFQKHKKIKIKKIKWFQKLGIWKPTTCAKITKTSYVCNLPDRFWQAHLVPCLQTASTAKKDLLQKLEGFQFALSAFVLLPSGHCLHWCTHGSFSGNLESSVVLFIWLLCIGFVQMLCHTVWSISMLLFWN